MYGGTIKTVILDRGFGFITAPQMADVFFHCNQLSDDLPFDETLQERRVRFSIEMGPKGQRATNVRPAD